jgi:hypothetical protein
LEPKEDRFVAPLRRDRANHNLLRCPSGKTPYRRVNRRRHK